MIADVALLGLAIVACLNVLACLVRVAVGPTGRDRITGVLFAGTTGSGLALIGSVLTQTPALRDIALGLVALAAVIVVVRVGAESRRQAPRSRTGAGPTVQAPASGGAPAASAPTNDAGAQS